MQTRPVLIMLAGDASDRVIDRTGNYDEMFLRMADYGNAGAAVVAVARGEVPESPERYSGTIVTGSPAMVTDKEPWSVKSGEWLRAAAEGGHKVFGVCYGHQLLGQALGGDAGYLPYRMELGTHTVTLAPGAARHPLLPELPPVFKANLIHSQAVTALPPGATVLAYNENDPHQIVAYGSNVISMQFHPEFDGFVTQILIDLVLGTTDPAGRANAKGIRLGAPAEDTPEAVGILRHFVARCLADG